MRLLLVAVGVVDGVGLCCVDSSLVRERMDCLVEAFGVLFVGRKERRVDSSLVRERRDCLGEVIVGRSDSQQQYYL